MEGDVPGFTLITGNRLELLAGKCCLDLMENPLPPMKQEIITVQSMGMMKWLSLRLAEQAGVWANCSYIFPNRMSSMLLNGFFPGSGNERYFDRDAIPWKVMRILKEAADNPVFGQTAGYIRNDPSGIKIYQLSSGISDIFDQYMTFRPWMITAWDRGADRDQWQAELWRLLTADMDSDNPPSLLERLSVMLPGRGYTPAGKLPERLTLFGISYLPMYHVNLLFAASMFMEIRMYMLNPSEKYWGDILKEKEKLKIIARFPVTPGDPETDLHLDSGNPLLASMGRPGRDFIRGIFSTDCQLDECYSAPEGSSLLSMIQQDIYHMTDRAHCTEKLPVEHLASDDSIVINSCHSPMRETEVLRDYILALFNGDPAIEPRDIIVMAPDIEKYSGCIESVFTRKDAGITFPFRIADRKPAVSEPSVSAFFSMLDLPDSRFTASRVLSFLDCVDVMECFGFSAADRERITGWIADSGIRWGTDGGYKEMLELPAEEANTFSAGIKRLITGLIVSGDELCLDVLPLASVDTGDAVLLGRFISYVEKLETALNLLGVEHTLDQWGEVFMFIINTFFRAGDDIPEAMMPVAEVASLLGEVMKSSGYKDPVGIAAVKEFAQSRISAPGSARDFISGAITFCEMLPMRSIPCRVVCILGMDSRSFPGKSRPASFDLMAASPRMGDRSIRDEERYMFLETIISAREKLYISYTGQNIINNTENDPSPVVSELIDYMVSFFDISEADKVRKNLITRQRLHRYSPAYFLPGTGLASFSQVGLKEAEAASVQSGDPPPFFTGKLAGTGVVSQVTVEDLAWFLRNPARALCTGRLGIYLEIKDDTPADDEPFEIERSVRYDLDSRLLNLAVTGGDAHELFLRMKAAGRIPHGAAGRALFNERVEMIGKFLLMIPGAFESPAAFAAQEPLVDDMRIKLKPGTLYKGRQVFASTGRLGTFDLLRAWISHLVMCISLDDIRTEFYFGENNKGDYSVKRVVWNALPDARNILSCLAGLYREGMTSPLEIFPDSSRAFAEAFVKPGKEEPLARGMKAAYETFYRFGRPENSDPYILKVFGPSYSPGKVFRDTAMKVYVPVFENIPGEA